MTNNVRAGSACPIFAAILLLICTTALAQQKDTYTDPRDSTEYKIVEIGEQVWMAKNLNYAADSSRCYDDKSSGCFLFGRLYNWETAMNICPSGWHLPSRDEWQTLVAFVGGYKIAGQKLKTNRIGTKTNNGTDDYGFYAVPGGTINSKGNFCCIGTVGSLWSSSQKGGKSISYASGNIYTMNMIFENDSYIYESTADRNTSRSVRCLKDSQEKTK